MVANQSFFYWWQAKKGADKPTQKLLADALWVVKKLVLQCPSFEASQDYSFESCLGVEHTLFPFDQPDGVFVTGQCADTA